MAGRVFPALGGCKIAFSHHVDIIQALRPVSMPSCSYLLYQANDLHPLMHFHLPSILTLEVKCAQWNVWRGNPQLATLCRVVATGVKSLTHLSVHVECSERLLVYILNLVPALTILELGVARHNALSTTFFQAFIVREPNADGASDMVGLPRHTTAPLCPSLNHFHLHYRRWLRGPRQKGTYRSLW
jgi:hypothetical protein